MWVWELQEQAGSGQGKAGAAAAASMGSGSALVWNLSPASAPCAPSLGDGLQTHLAVSKHSWRRGCFYRGFSHYE